jgi:hypothetical protein
VGIENIENKVWYFSEELEPPWNFFDICAPERALLNTFRLVLLFMRDRPPLGHGRVKVYRVRA